MAEAGPPQPEDGPRLGWDEKVVRLNEALAAQNLPYAFGGAIALNYHREPRSTLDIDINIFVSPEHKDEVLAALGEVYDLSQQNKVARDLTAHGQARSSWGDTAVDLFLADTEFHDAMATRVQRQPFGDTTIPVLSIEDLLICKALFDRPKDWIDIEAVGRSRHGELDRRYIDSWLDQFLLPDDPKLARIREALA